LLPTDTEHLIAPWLTARDVPPLKKRQHYGDDENQFQDGPQANLVKAWRGHDARYVRESRRQRGQSEFGGGG